MPPSCVEYRSLCATLFHSIAIGNFPAMRIRYTLLEVVLTSSRQASVGEKCLAK